MTKAKVTFPSAPDTSAIDIEDEGSLIVSNPTAMNFTGPGVTVTENPTGTAEVDIPGLQYWTESEDATTQQSTIFTPNNSATDVNAVLLPKGTGANTAQTPDGTNAGGNARGAYATDWQKERGDPTDVASGLNASILGGKNNTASGIYSSVLGGDSNNATNQSSLAHGSSNTASGTRSVAFGSGNTAAGSRAFAAGNSCIANGLYSRANGNSSAIGSYSSADGKGRARLIGAKANSGFVGPLYNYFSINAASTDELTTGDTTFLGLQGGEGAGRLDSDINISNDNFWNIKCFWIAVVESISGTATGVNVGDYMTQCQLFGMKKVGVAAATLTTITTVATHGDASITGSATLIHTIGSSIYLTPTFTAPTFSGGGTLTMRIQAQYDITEIAFT